MKALIIFFLATALVSANSFAQCNYGYNLALGKTAVASSLENTGYPASNAFDGNGGTRWSSAFSDPQYIYVDLGSVNSLCEVDLHWENAYASGFHIDISNDAITWTTVATISGNTSQDNYISISGSGRYVRMFGTSRATGYGYSLYEFLVFGTAASPACSSNIAIGKMAVSTSDENVAFPASNAVDNNPGTRWSSAFSDPQSLTVDLGMIYSLCSVELDWEAAYASSYLIQISMNGTTWFTVATVTGNTGLVNVFSISGNGRYIRMAGQTRATGYGYSLWEFKVFGDATILPVSWLSFSGEAVTHPRSVNLNWSTSSEVSNDSFEIQRQTVQGYTSIGTMATQNNSGSSVLNYHFTDNDPAAGENFYRIKQTDIDGRYSYSKVISVTMNGSSNELVTLYPNPVITGVHIRAGSTPIDSYSLFSAAGSLLSRGSGIAAGQDATIPMSSYPSGIYMIKMESQGKTQIRKIVKLQ